MQFGRRKVRLTVLRLGWSPENSIPGLVDTLFRKREADAKKATPAAATAARAGPVRAPGRPRLTAPASYNSIAPPAALLLRFPPMHAL